MDPKHDGGRMLLAPGAHVGTSSVSFPNADRRSTPPPFPPVDEHLVQPEVSREEIIRGRKIVTMGANPPHAEAQVRADFVIAPHVCDGYVAAADLLTRASAKSNFATDVSVRKKGVDPATGSRYLEELSFEIVNEQSMRDVIDKADDLSIRGVRRVFAIFVKTDEICEWSKTKREFVPLDKNGLFEDPLFIRPIAVHALIDATLAECEVVRALSKKGNPEIKRMVQDGLDEGHKKGLDEGHKKGLDEASRTMLLKFLRARFGTVSDAIVSCVEAASAEQIDVWADNVLLAPSIEDVFA
jgi:hypothetical protein